MGCGHLLHTLAHSPEVSSRSLFVLVSKSISVFVTETRDWSGVVRLGAGHIQWAGMYS